MILQPRWAISFTTPSAHLGEGITPQATLRIVTSCIPVQILGVKRPQQANETWQKTELKNGVQKAKCNQRQKSSNFSVIQGPIFSKFIFVFWSGTVSIHLWQAKKKTNHQPNQPRSSLQWMTISPFDGEQCINYHEWNDKTLEVDEQIMSSS